MPEFNNIKEQYNIQPQQMKTNEKKTKNKHRPNDHTNNIYVYPACS